MPRKKSGKIPITWVLGFAVTLFMAFVAYSALQLNVQANQASIDYKFGNAQSIIRNDYDGYTNSIDINCKNGGNIDGKFALKLTLIGASFSTNTEMPYSATNSTYVTFSYILHKGESASKTVYYTIDQNSPSFSMSLSIEKYSNPLTDNAIYPYSIHYNYNADSQCYELVT
jgi:hypothetical protein